MIKRMMMMAMMSTMMMMIMIIMVLMIRMKQIKAPTVLGDFLTASEEQFRRNCGFRLKAFI